MHTYKSHNNNNNSLIMKERIKLEARKREKK